MEMTLNIKEKSCAAIAIESVRARQCSFDGQRNLIYRLARSLFIGHAYPSTEASSCGIGALCPLALYLYCRKVALFAAVTRYISSARAVFPATSINLPYPYHPILALASAL